MSHFPNWPENKINSFSNAKGDANANGEVLTSFS